MKLPKNMSPETRQYKKTEPKIQGRKKKPEVIRADRVRPLGVIDGGMMTGGTRQGTGLVAIAVKLQPQVHGLLKKFNYCQNLSKGGFSCKTLDLK